ncbi:DUF4982 domain-containing protein [Bacteroidales bacterium]|nr:DUF4982 domain-containing protein [Bacteroidales bacterium]
MINYKRVVHVFAFVLGLILTSCSLENANTPDADFNKGWLFYKGEVKNAEQFNFSDVEWRILDLPHDWAIEGPFSSEYNARYGGLPIHGTGWYRKHFSIDKKNEGKKISIEFDGAMKNAHVWLNGEFVGERPYGYIGFELDLTPYVKFGEDNVIAVRLTPEDLSSRWYPGAGLYRNVRLKINNPVHVAQYGTYITTPEVSKESAKIRIETTVENFSAEETIATLTTKIADKNGNIIASQKSKISVLQKGNEKVIQEISVQSPLLWDINAPNLYKAISEVVVGTQISDVYETEFGIRTIEYTAANGFKLNGRQVKFKGVCMHHDMGPLGSAINYRAKERQMEIMLSMGVNAVRTSHNPPSPEWIQICDRLGILMQVEAFDEWKKGKIPNGYNLVWDKWHETDLRDMIRRDRNHPSVVMWSIGNEILEQSDKNNGWKMAKELTDICHEEDSTRPVTAGFNYYPAPFKNKLAYQIDVVGMNYWPLEYDDILEANPDMIVYGSETSSQTSSRGVYHLPIDPMPQKETGHVSGYDVIVGPPWAYPPDAEWDALEACPKSLGEFMWTGFDYLGEPTPYGGRDNSTNGYWNDDWPSHSSYFAPVDLVGLPKDRYFLYQSQWTSEPMVHLLPHWNWEGKEGDSIPVFVYTNCEEAELFLNGKSLGKKVKGKDLTEIPADFHSYPAGTYKSKYRLSWMVAYEPGAVKVIAYNGGEPKAEKEVKTAGDPATIVVSADRSEITADGKDLSYITVWAEDANGTPCPLAENMIDFKIEGNGALTGVGSGNPRSLESFQAPHRKLFSGKCMLIVKSTEEAGNINITASSKGLKEANIVITTRF